MTELAALTAIPLEDDAVMKDFGEWLCTRCDDSGVAMQDVAETMASVQLGRLKKFSNFEKALECLGWKRVGNLKGYLN